MIGYISKISVEEWVASIGVFYLIMGMSRLPLMIKAVRYQVAIHKMRTGKINTNVEFQEAKQGEQNLPTAARVLYAINMCYMVMAWPKYFKDINNTLDLVDDIEAEFKKGNL